MVTNPSEVREAAFPPLPTPASKALQGISDAGEEGRPEGKPTAVSFCPQTKQEQRTWKRSCIAFAPLTETSLQPANSSASEEFALRRSSLPPDQKYIPLFFITISLWKVQYYLGQGCQYWTTASSPPHCWTQAWKETSQLFVTDGFFIIVGVQPK